MFENIPAELQALPQWVCWRYETVDGRQTKVPYSAITGGKASVNHRSTWASFGEAVAASQHHSGIGLVLTQDAGYTVIDLDNKPEKPCTEEQLARHTKIYKVFQSYTEMSTSGTGVHIVVKGTVPSGVHRDNVEIYSNERYMIFTGNVVRPLPVQDYSGLLGVIHAEMKAQTRSVTLEEVEELLDDAALVEMASNASNGAKFDALCNGDQTGYESQSEADFALLSIIAFYTQSNEQVRRIFRMTALGKREKAIRNDTYLNFALSKIRANQPAPVDMAAAAANAERLVQSMAKKEEAPPPMPQPIAEAPTAHTDHAQNRLPPGLIGEMAQFFYANAIRPVPEIALAASLALAAGVAGRAYNISDTGLNQYLVLLARTGSGKEGAQMGIDKLVSAARKIVPMVDQFVGPAAFASGQALVKALAERPSFVSVLGEFGLTLQQLSDAKANSAQIMMRKVLLDLYAKSGWNSTLRSSVYSDSEKNTRSVQAPAVTILGESTPETFFEGLDASHISEGLIPRFCFIEYSGPRPPRNPRANQAPPEALVRRFVDLVTVSLTTSNNNTCVPVPMDPAALALMDKFDARADYTMNHAGNEVEIQLWNRAHLKALKLAALVAVGCNPHHPLVTPEVAQWAIDFVTAEVTRVCARFTTGDVGTGDSKQMNDLRRVVENYFQTKGGGKYPAMCKDGIIPYAYLFSRVANLSSFKKDRLGAKQALRGNVNALIDSGALIEVPTAKTQASYSYTGLAYAVSSHW